MNKYANGFNLNINDVATITFIHNLNGNNTDVAMVCVQFEFLKGMVETITKAIDEHEEKIARLVKN